MEHGLREGQKVACISENFPVIKKYGGVGKESNNTPKQNEVLVIDEILGDFLRFDKYDTNESFNWWKADRFVPFDEIELEIENLIKMKQNGSRY